MPQITPVEPPSAFHNSPYIFQPQPDQARVSSHWDVDPLKLSIRRQMQLPPGSYDPFLRYPAFPARLYSAEMGSGSESLDVVPLGSVLSHVARYKFLNQAMILNMSRVNDIFQ